MGLYREPAITQCGRYVASGRSFSKFIATNIGGCGTKFFQLTWVSGVGGASVGLLNHNAQGRGEGLLSM